MKLRNKKTGEIKTAYVQVIVENNHPAKPLQYDTQLSLAELNEEWEDCEEPKDFWFIDPEILIACESTEPLLCDKKVAIETMKQIGNYFDTREEAEKAMEKLKAWKRLKDKGFRFWTIDPIHLNIGYSFENYTEEDIPELKKDLDLLFGGEE